MKYYLDTEFDGFGGSLLSMALIREDGWAFSKVLYNGIDKVTPWVKEHVVPILFADPYSEVVAKGKLAYLLELFFDRDDNPHIYVDWPDDIKYFCEALITAPGMMINIPKISFHLVRVDAYPTCVKGAIQHNAFWDALALKTMIESM